MVSFALESVRDLSLQQLGTPDPDAPDARAAAADYCARFLQLMVWESQVRTWRVTIAQASRVPESAHEYFEQIFGTAIRRLADHLESRTPVDPALAWDAAYDLVALTVLPRLMRTLLGVEAPLPGARPPTPEQVADSVDLPRIRAAVDLVVPGRPRPPARCRRARCAGCPEGDDPGDRGLMSVREQARRGSPGHDRARQRPHARRTRLRDPSAGLGRPGEGGVSATSADRMLLAHPARGVAAVRGVESSRRVRVSTLQGCPRRRVAHRGGVEGPRVWSAPSRPRTMEGPEPPTFQVTMSELLRPDDPTDRAAGSGPRRRGRSKRRHRFGTAVVVGGTATAMVLGLGSVWYLRHLDDNVDYQSYDAQLSDRPAKVDTGPQEPVNILVMGSDSRDGEGNNLDGLTDGGERSDTTILFHLSADRSFAYGVSIPRDSLVDRPDCTAADGSTIEGAADVQWNEAFGVGGPACTMQQFEQLTGVRLDHYVKVDFNGFRDMVDAIDGVEVCLPEPIEDPSHGINLPAGTRELEGYQALNYVRARYTLGDGSDLGRIKRQQAFVAAMAAKVISGDTLARPDRLLPFLDAATKSLQTDYDSVRDIASVGGSFQGIGLDNIRFVTVPWQYSPEDPNRVEWLPEAGRLWQRVIDDEPLPRSLKKESISAEDDVRGGSGSGAGGSGGPGSGSADRESAGLCA